jgi:hypothetical protein
MSETTKRGSPTEDGWYICLYRGRFAEPAFDIATYQKNGVLYWADGTRVSCVEVILAHRRHEPLVVPELRELESMPTPKRVVVFYGNRPCIADKYQWSNDVTYHVHRPRTHWAPDCVSCKLDELTKEQCEAEGYKWPL